LVLFIMNKRKDGMRGRGKKKEEEGKEEASVGPF
jgi:hypothetical protein